MALIILINILSINRLKIQGIIKLLTTKTWEMNSAKIWAATFAAQGSDFAMKCCLSTTDLCFGPLQKYVVVLPLILPHCRFFLCRQFTLQDGPILGVRNGSPTPMNFFWFYFNTEKP